MNITILESKFFAVGLTARKMTMIIYSQYILEKSTGGMLKIRKGKKS